MTSLWTSASPLLDGFLPSVTLCSEEPAAAGPALTQGPFSSCPSSPARQPGAPWPTGP